MLNFKKKSMSTVLATAMLLSSIAIPAIVVHAAESPDAVGEDSYAIYAEIPGGDEAWTRVDMKGGGDAVPVWIGGGNAKGETDEGATYTTNGKTVQLSLYNVVSGKYTNVTNAKGVLWAVTTVSTDTKPTLQLKIEGTKVAKNENATVSKGKVTAGKVAPKATEEVYVIAYQMNTFGGKAVKLKSSSEAGTKAAESDKYDYIILAAAKVDVKQAATMVTVFNDKDAVTAFETNTKATHYKTGGTVGTATDGNPLKKATAASVGINETTNFFISGIGGSDKNKSNIAIGADDDNTYTISVAKDTKANMYYAAVGKLSSTGIPLKVNAEGAEDNDAGTLVAPTDSITLTQDELVNGFYVQGVAVAPTVKGTNVTFKPSKATVTITNNQSGKSAKVTVTVTNGVSKFADTDAIEADESPYNAVETYTFDLAKGVYGNTTGAKAATLLTELGKLTISNRDDTANKVTVDSKGYALSKGPMLTLNGTTQDVVVGTADAAPKDLSLLVKPAVAVYYYKDGKTAYDEVNTDDGADGNYAKDEIVEKITADVAAASAAKPAVPKIAKGSTLPYTVATGFKAAIAKDNSTLTLTTPKIGFLGGDNKVRDIFVVVSYGGNEDNVLVLPITITPKTQGKYTLAVGGTADSKAIVKESETKTKYELATKLTVDTAVDITLDGDSETTFELIKGKNTEVTTTAGGATTGTVKATKAGAGDFKIKIDGFTYTVTITAEAAASGGETNPAASVELKVIAYTGDANPSKGETKFTATKAAGATSGTGTFGLIAADISTPFKIVKSDGTTALTLSDATTVQLENENKSLKIASPAGGTVTVTVDGVAYVITVTYSAT